MLASQLQALPGSSLVWAVAVAVLYIFLYFNRSKVLSILKLKKVDVIDLTKGDASDYRPVLLDAYQKYTDRLYRMPFTHHSSIVLPNKFIHEIVSLPDSKSSFLKEAYHRFLGKYTGVGSTGQDIIDAVRIDLTRNIANVIDDLQDEISFATAEKLGDCKDWTAFTFYPTLAPIVAQITGRIFVGLPLCREPEWIDLLVNYTRCAFAGAWALWEYPQWLHPLIALWKPEIVRVKNSLDRARRVMIPILEKRKQDMDSCPTFVAPNDMITWLVERAGPSAWDPAYQSLNQMQLGLASIHTTTALVTHAFYELCAHPEYIQPLREEWEQVLEQERGKKDKQFNMKLRKMDSFLKEVQRMNPASLISIARYVETDITLSNGQVLPKGTFTAASSYGVNRDPEIFPNPDVFDPWRFVRLREEVDKVNARSDLPADARWQFVTTSIENLNFGHGKHACPGRFFVANEVKLLLGHIIYEYDIKFADPVKGKPENIFQGPVVINPDPTCKLMFRKR